MLRKANFGARLPVIRLVFWEVGRVKKREEGPPDRRLGARRVRSTAIIF